VYVLGIRDKIEVHQQLAPAVAILPKELVSLKAEQSGLFKRQVTLLWNCPVNNSRVNAKCNDVREPSRYAQYCCMMESWTECCSVGNKAAV
jgi:hypothetical protein